MIVEPNLGTTAIPNLLLDKVMPKLGETSWKLLCVVVRQTRGWRMPDGSRKQADWMSHSQLRRRTGRSSAAVSRAIDVLVRSGIIVVRDLFGNPLQSPSERRRSHSRLVFGLHPNIDSEIYLKRIAHNRFVNLKRKNDKTDLDKRKQQQQSYRTDRPKGPYS